MAGRLESEKENAESDGDILMDAKGGIYDGEHYDHKHAGYRNGRLILAAVA